MLPQPFRADGVTAFGAAVAGDRQRMQELVDQTLNCHGRHARYVVVAPTIFFSFMRMPRLSSAGDPGGSSFAETELNVTFLLAAMDLPPTAAIYMPALWLDSGPALIAGREIYGYPKQFGLITMPDRIGDPAVMEAQSCVLPTQQPGPASDQTILRMRRTDGDLLEKTSNLTDAAAALELLLSTVVQFDLSSLDSFGLAWPGFDLKNLRMAWMRQLPSLAMPGLASFRSAAEGRFDIALRSAGLLRGQYEIEIPFLHSVRMAEAFGLAQPGQNVKVPAIAAYHMDFDLIFGPARDLWTET
jgi:hypothetical protein